MDIAVQLFALASSLLIIVLCERRINEMQPPVKPLIRVAFVLFLVGAFWAIIEIALGEVPTWYSVVLRVGLAALLYETRGCESSCIDLLYHREVVVAKARASVSSDHSLPGVS